MRILYLTAATFSAANAAALRNVGLASAMALSGHEVIIATPDDPTVDAREQWAASYPRGVTVVHAGLKAPGHSAGKRIVSFCGGSHGDLGALLEDWAPDLVILYQSFLPLLARLRAATSRRGTPLVLDITEWYDGASLPLGVLGPHNALNQISMRLAVPRMPATIAISHPLAAHCARRGARTIVVPPLFDVTRHAPDSAVGLPSRDPRLTIAVTGSGITPGHKDRLALLSMASVARRIDPEGKRLSIKVAGPSRDAVARQLGGSLPAAFDILGGLSWSDSLDLVSSADFTLLLRDPSNRRAVFGFPSKVPESLLLGTPILGNAIGDLDRYLAEGRNAALVDFPDATGLEMTLRRVMEDDAAWSRASIRAEAERNFSPECYARPLDEFLTGELSAA